MTTIYHNPRCSKSRATLELLVQNDVDPEIILYLDHAPDVATLKQIIEMLNCTIRVVMRKGESEYKNLDLDNPDLSEDQLILAVSENPILLERPIVVNNGKAAIGRPPENVLNII
jgi:arsenate reductase